MKQAYGDFNNKAIKFQLTPKWTFTSRVQVLGEGSGEANEHKESQNLAAQSVLGLEFWSSLEKPRRKHLPTPLSALNELSAQKIIEYSLTHEEDPEGGYKVAGSLVVILQNGSSSGEVSSETGPFEDLSYAQHKVAIALLKKASPLRRDIWKSYQSLSKKPVLRKGERFRQEDLYTEHEGSEEENGIIGFSALEAKADEILKPLVAFLNTAGGTIYLGIHDGGVIQGIEINEAQFDQVEKLFSCKIESKVKPSCAPFYVMDYSPVVHSEGERKLWVLSFTVWKSDSVHLASGKEFYRNGRHSHEYVRGE